MNNNSNHVDMIIKTPGYTFAENDVKVTRRYSDAMLFWRYLVYRHFASTIIGESMNAVKNFGSLWHLCLFIWSSIFVILVREQFSVMATKVNNGLFLFSVFVLLMYYSVLKKFGLFRKNWFRKFRKLAKIVLFATTPVFFVLNMWIPIQRRVSCIFAFQYPSKYDPREEICPYLSVLLACVFTVLVMVHETTDNQEEIPGDKYENGKQSKTVKESARRKSKRRAS